MTIDVAKDFAKSHKNCMVCSQGNNYSWKLNFIDHQDGKTYAKFLGNNSFQGYGGILHGGVISTLLDATMTHCLFHNDVIALTGDLRVRFLHQIPHDSIIELQAWIIKAKKGFYVLKAEAICGHKVMAWSEAKFMPTKKAMS